MKKGLVLEGGAMRGLFTAGVMDAMMEEKIAFDGMAGVSAGAAFGCNYKSGQIGRVLRYNTRYCRDRRYCSLHSLWTTGDLYGADFCYHVLPETLDLFDNEAFCASPMEFYAVCTDVDTGEAVYHLCEEAAREGVEWIRASASMPLVSRVVEIGGQRLLDGGIADAVPLKFMQEKGYEKCVVVLTRPRRYRKEKDALLPVIQRMLKAYPRLAQAMERRHVMYNETMDYIEREEKKGSAFVIRPRQALDVRRVERDAEKLRQAYREGREAAQERMEALKAFLADERKGAGE